MNALYSLTVDTNGHIYIVDRYNAAIRKVDSATGIISTVAGTGEPATAETAVPAHYPRYASPTIAFWTTTEVSLSPISQTRGYADWSSIPE